MTLWSPWHTPGLALAKLKYQVFNPQSGAAGTIGTGAAVAAAEAAPSVTPVTGFPSAGQTITAGIGGTFDVSAGIAVMYSTVEMRRYNYLPVVDYLPAGVDSGDIQLETVYGSYASGFFACGTDAPTPSATFPLQSTITVTSGVGGVPAHQAVPGSTTYAVYVPTGLIAVTPDVPVPGGWWTPAATVVYDGAAPIRHGALSGYPALDALAGGPFDAGSAVDAVPQGASSVLDVTWDLSSDLFCFGAWNSFVSGPPDVWPMANAGSSYNGAIALDAPDIYVMYQPPRYRWPIRFVPPLRWRQRDDGIGVGGPAGHRHRTSQQLSLRQRTYH